MAVHIFSLTDAGQRLAATIAENIGSSAELFHRPKPFAQQVHASFAGGHRLVMICATGIAVRTLAPVLADKYKDPAVLVLDELGQFVIPLLSGHEGGANEFARQLADQLPALHPISTQGNPRGSLVHIPFPRYKPVSNKVLLWFEPVALAADQPAGVQTHWRRPHGRITTG